MAGITLLEIFEEYFLMVRLAFESAVYSCMSKVMGQR